MKTLILSLILLGALISANGKDKCNYLTYIFVIDGEIDKVYNGRFVYFDSLKNMTDTISFVSKIGTINFSDYDLKKFNEISSSISLKLQFSWQNVDYENINYECVISRAYLDYGYLIINVYNYSNKKYRNEFVSNSGYGIEWKASEVVHVIPRKKKKTK